MQICIRSFQDDGALNGSTVINKELSQQRNPNRRGIWNSKRQIDVVTFKTNLESHLMCVAYNVIAKCKCLVRVFIDSIHWFDSLLRFLTSIHWFDSLIRFITSIDWSLRSLEFKAANQCSDLLDPLKKSPDAYSIEFRLFHVASAASWVASPSPVCSVVTF